MWCMPQVKVCLAADGASSRSLTQWRSVELSADIGAGIDPRILEDRITARCTAAKLDMRLTRMHLVAHGGVLVPLADAGPGWLAKAERARGAPPRFVATRRANSAQVDTPLCKCHCSVL